MEPLKGLAVAWYVSRFEAEEIESDLPPDGPEEALVGLRHRPGWLRWTAWVLAVSALGPLMYGIVRTIGDQVVTTTGVTGG